jgi:hypothetical protein
LQHIKDLQSKFNLGPFILCPEHLHNVLKGRKGRWLASSALECGAVCFPFIYLPLFEAMRVRIKSVYFENEVDV